MKKKFILEISVESLEAAAAAERGGADRIELCSDLSLGGLTPVPGLLHAVRQQIKIPIFVMIRPRAGDFLYSSAEFAQMKKSIRAARESGAGGLVLGILKANHTVDVKRSGELIEFAEELPVTFHRAFDECRDLSQALEDVVSSGASRILTSGGAASAPEGAGKLRELVGAIDELAKARKHGMAARQLTIIPGAGIHAGNILQLAVETGAQEVHSSLSSVFTRRKTDLMEFEKEVRAMRKKLSTLSIEK